MNCSANYINNSRAESSIVTLILSRYSRSVDKANYGLHQRSALVLITHQTHPTQYTYNQMTPD